MLTKKLSKYDIELCFVDVNQEYLRIILKLFF